jgi:AcrR family transcriptional regulator
MADLQLRELILASAANLFEKRGYAAVSMRIIAHGLGVTTGSLYYYFKDKDEIVREILDTGHKRVHEEVRSAVDSLGSAASKSEKIQAGIRAHLAALFEKDSFPAANVRIFAHVPDHLRRAVRPGRKAYEEYWIDLLSDAADPQTLAEARQLTMLLFGAANWTIEWYRPSRDSLDDIASNLASTFSPASAKRSAGMRAAKLRRVGRGAP